LEGNYTQIKDFLKDIENFSRLLSIESFSIVFNNKTLTLKVEIKAYSLTNNEDVIPSFTTELGRPNPFAPVQ
jgi:Tfp pilus assembly protein PilO